MSQIFLIQCSYIESETMALIDELSDALKEAMKAKDKPKLDKYKLRLLKRSLKKGRKRQMN